MSAEYEKHLEELASLERHLVQAKARALTEDEQLLAAFADSCAGYGEMGLPMGEIIVYTYLFV